MSAEGTKSKKEIGWIRKIMGFFLEIIQKNKFRFILVGSVVAIVMGLLVWNKFFTKKEKPEIGLSGLEKPKIYKPLDFNLRSREDQRNPERSGYGTKSSRNYQSEIAVYIAPKEEKKENQSAEGANREAVKNWGLPSGTKIPAYTSGTIFSFNVEAPVSSIVSKDVLKGDSVIIPKNSKFLGTASVLKSLNRINVSFHKLIFPDGREVNVRAMALSEDGSSGIKGKVDKQTNKKFLKGVGEALLGGANLFSNSLRTEAYSLQDELRGNLSENLLGQARTDLSSERIETSITVESFTPIEVLLLEAV